MRVFLSLTNRFSILQIFHFLDQGFTRVVQLVIVLRHGLLFVLGVFSGFAPTKEAQRVTLRDEDRSLTMEYRAPRPVNAPTT